MPGNLDGTRARAGLSREKKALVIDGPLKGRAINATNAEFYALDPKTDKRITYTVTQVGFAHGGTKMLLRIATLDKPNWSAEELADAMLNDSAKSALIPEEGARTRDRLETRAFRR